MGRCGVKDREATLKQKKHAKGRVVLLDDGVYNFDHRPCSQHPVKLVADIRKSVDDRNLGDGVELLALVEDEIDMGHRFKATTESALRLPDAFGDGSKLAVVRAEQHDDAMGFPERVPTQHDALIAPNRHGCRVEPVCDTNRQSENPVTVSGVENFDLFDIVDLINSVNVLFVVFIAIIMVTMGLLWLWVRFRPSDHMGVTSGKAFFETE